MKINIPIIKVALYVPKLNFKLNIKSSIISLLLIIIFCSALYFNNKNLFTFIKKEKPNIKNLAVHTKKSGDNSKIDQINNLPKFRYIEYDKNSFILKWTYENIPIKVAISKDEYSVNTLKYYKLSKYYFKKLLLINQTSSRKNANKFGEKTIFYLKKIIEYNDPKKEICKYAYLKLGLVYDIMKNYKKALSFYNLYLKKYKGSFSDDIKAKIYHNIGYCHYYLKDLKTAEKYFDDAIKLNPELIQPYIGLANIKLFWGNKYIDKNINQYIKADKAYRVYKKALENEKLKDNSWLNFNAGYLAYKYDLDTPLVDIDLIKQHFTKVNKNDKNLYGKARYYLYELSNNIDEKLNYLKESMKYKSDFNNYLELAELYKQKKMSINQIIDLYKKALLYNPDTIDKMRIRCNIADLLYEKKDYYNSYRVYDKISSNDLFLQAILGKAKIELKFNFYKLAFNDYLKIILNINNNNIIDNRLNLNSYLLIAYENIAKILSLQNDPDRYNQIIDCYKNTLELNNSDLDQSKYYFNLALIYKKMKDYNKTLDYFFKAENKNKHNILIKKNIAELCYELKKYQKAIDYLKLIISNKIYADNPKLLFMLAYSYYSKGKNKDALKYFEETVKMSKNNILIKSISYKNIGIIHYHNAKINKESNNLSQYKELIKKAINSLNRSIKYNNKDADAYFYAGICYFYDNNLDNAQINFSLALKLNDKISKYHSALGNCYFEKGLYKLAEAEYKKAISLDSANIEAQYNLSLINNN